MKTWWLIWLWSFYWLVPIEATDATVLTVRLLDAKEQPLAGVIVELILIKYNGSNTGGGEEELFGNCTTRPDGGCSFEVANPPRLWDGYIQGWLQVQSKTPGGNLRQLVGWYGDEAEITLKLSDLYLAATLAAVGIPERDGPYEEQHPYVVSSATTPAMEILTVLTASDTSVAPTPRTTPTPTESQPGLHLWWAVFPILLALIFLGFRGTKNKEHL